MEAEERSVLGIGVRDTSFCFINYEKVSCNYPKSDPVPMLNL